MRKLLPLAALLAVAPLFAAPVPKSIKGPGTIYIWSYTQPPVLNLYTPDGDHIRKVDFGKDADFDIEGVSPDGKLVVVTTRDPGRGFAWPKKKVYLLELDRCDKGLPEEVIYGWCPSLVWSHDGKTAFASVFTQDTLNAAPKKGEVYESEVVKIDLTTGKKTQLELGLGHRVAAVSPDGNELATEVLAQIDGKSRLSCFVTPVGRKDILPSPDTDDCRSRWSAFPDSQPWPDEGGCPVELKLPPTANSKEQVLRWPVELMGKTPGRWCLSPRRDKVLLSWQEEYKLPAKWAEYGPQHIHKLGVCDLDGTNLRVIYTENPEVPDGLRFKGLDFAWR